METELEEANGQNHDMSSCEEKRLAAMRYVMANFTREGWLKPINNEINNQNQKGSPPGISARRPHIEESTANPGRCQGQRGTLV